MLQPGGAASRRRKSGSNVTSTALWVSPAFNAIGGAPARLVADLSAAQRVTLRGNLRDRPGGFVGHEVVRLSTTPVLRGHRLEAASFVLRIDAAWRPDGLRVVPGGFCLTSQHKDARAIPVDDGARTADVSGFCLYHDRRIARAWAAGGLCQRLST